MGWGEIVRSRATEAVVFGEAGPKWPLGADWAKTANRILLGMSVTRAAPRSRTGVGSPGPHVISGARPSIIRQKAGLAERGFFGVGRTHSSVIMRAKRLGLLQPIVNCSSATQLPRKAEALAQVSDVDASPALPGELRSIWRERSVNDLNTLGFEKFRYRYEIPI